jgi:hypothetical protein
MKTLTGMKPKINLVDRNLSFKLPTFFFHRQIHSTIRTKKNPTNKKAKPLT